MSVAICSGCGLPKSDCECPYDPKPSSVLEAEELTGKTRTKPYDHGMLEEMAALLDLVLAEWVSDPSTLAGFDLRIMGRTQAVLAEYRKMRT